MCDASDTGIGAIITQKTKQGEDGELIGIYSYMFRTAEKHYTTIENELQAITNAVNPFSQFVLSSENQTEVKTDYYNLIQLEKFKRLRYRSQKCLDILNTHPLVISFVAGEQNIYTMFFQGCTPIQKNGAIYT
jgi:lysyl-tRNA synthetase class II